MRRKFPRIFLLFPASLISLLFTSCGPAVLDVTETSTPPIPSESPTLTAEITPTPAATIMLTDTTLTAVMEATFAAIPTNTPPPWATIIPAAGDLGWGSVHGTVIDGVTNLPIEGATVTCEQYSDTSPYLCNGVTTTNSDGIYVFTPVFFHDTDRITLLVEAPGYIPWSFEIQEALIPPADFRVDLGLFPVTGATMTPTPFIVMCTAVACDNGVLVCGATNGCPAGCGAICIPSTPTP